MCMGADVTLEPIKAIHMMLLTIRMLISFMFFKVFITENIITKRTL